MFIRQVKKKCGVRGCRNIETFAIARTKGELGNVFICASCLAEALSGVDEARKAYAERHQANKVSTPPPLFYNPVVAVEESAAAIEEPDEIEEAEPETNEEVSEVEETAEEPSEKCICTECGKEFDTEKGLNMHKRIHEKE